MNTSQKDCMYCGDPGTPTVPDKDKEITELRELIISLIK